MIKKQWLCNYVKSIRRARRSNPTSRTGGFAGSDSSAEDTGIFIGTVNTYAWKLLEKKTMLVPFCKADPTVMTVNSDGSYVKEDKEIMPAMLYQDKSLPGVIMVVVGVVTVAIAVIFVLVTEEVVLLNTWFAMWLILALAEAIKVKKGVTGGRTNQ